MYVCPAEILSRLSSVSFLFRGVQRGYFSLSKGAQQDHKPDELLISASNGNFGAFGDKEARGSDREPGATEAVRPCSIKRVQP